MRYGTGLCVFLVMLLAYSFCNDTTGPTQSGTSDGPLVLTNPKGGETVRVGDTLRIRWDLDTTRTSITEVNLYASADGKTWVLLNTEMAVNMEDPQWRNFLWVVPDTLEYPWFMDPKPDPVPLVNQQVRIKVSEYDGPLEDQSGPLSVVP